MSLTSTSDALGAALACGDAVIVEPEGFPVLESVGIACPRFMTVFDRDGVDAVTLAALGTERVVVKVASASILHRSDIGGVAVVPNAVADVRDAIATMERRLGTRAGRDTAANLTDAQLADVRATHGTTERFPAPSVRFTISAFVPHHAGPGGELLASLRWTDEFGAVVTLGPGGIYAETLAKSLRPGDDVAVWAVDGLTRRRVIARASRLPLVRAVTGALRGQRALVTLDALADAILSLAGLAAEGCPVPIRECEINPLAVAPGGLVALDVLIRFDQRVPASAPPRPLEKLERLLAPRTLAIAGVSEQMNPGHIILRNSLAEGFPSERVAIVKPNASSIDGCRAVASLAELDGPVDLLVLAVAARHVPAMLMDVIEHRRAESVIVIPGGLEEKAGGGEALASVREALARSRATPWGGPLVNGGNCLGVRSLPGRYDTLFIPPHKMPARPASVSPVAIISQSGAFAVAKAGKLGPLNPKYLVTIGNQMDLTVGDYVTWLARDESIRIFGVYVEGFRPGDGLQLVRAARAITASGRLIILYRAGRTVAGAAASASHTASMAGDFVATRELAADAGVLLVDSLEAFEDAVRVAVALESRRPRGTRLGAISNAGFECVAMADSLGPFVLTDLSPNTRAKLTALLASAHIDGVVDVHNPLDVTPMANDEVFVDAARILLEDERVDVGIVGCVPLTPAMQTLAAGPGHDEDVARETAIAARVARLWQHSRKPWVAVVDAGAQYDPMVHALEAAGVVTFRTADRALKALALFQQAVRARATE